jgi:hypothetical protein
MPRSITRWMTSIGCASSPMRSASSGLRPNSRITTRTTSGRWSHVRRTIAAMCRSWSAAGSSVSSTLAIRSSRTLQFSWKTASSTSSFDLK